MQAKELPPAENDVAVLLLFFTGTEALQRIFNIIRQARPARLFLYQDGPRNEAETIMTIAARNIVADEQIDWQCDVRRNYHTTNQGMRASTYDSLQWAFCLHDKCIVLEESSTPAVTFVRFCTELLHRYENDLRIGMIAGVNHEETTDSPYDYLFTTMIPVWGWASWRRVVDGWDSTYSVVDDEFNMHQLETLSQRECGWKKKLKMMRRHKLLGQPTYETVLWSYLALHSCLTIVPTRNMIHNSAMPAHELTFPLRHPRLVIEDVAYKHRVSRIIRW